MRLIPRRKFLQDSAALLAASSIPLSQASAERSVTPLSGVDYRAFANDLFDWHCNTFFDFKKHLGAKDRGLITRCTHLMRKGWGMQVDNDFVYSLFSFSHRVKGDKINSSRAAFGSFRYADRIRPIVLDILRENNVDLGELPHQDHIFGLGWDVELQHFKPYMYFEDMAQITDPYLTGLLKRGADIERHKTGLASITFINGKLHERKVYIALKEKHPPAIKKYPFIDSVVHTNYMITEHRGIVPQVDLAHAAPLSGFNAAGKHLIGQYNRRFPGIGVDTVAFQGHDEFTLYFP